MAILSELPATNIFEYAYRNSEMRKPRAKAADSKAEMSEEEMQRDELACSLVATTSMGRGLLIAEYFYEETREDGSTKLVPFYIATSHFESLDMPSYRESRHKQMKDTFGKIFDYEENVVVVGDFNFDNPSEYKRNISDFCFKDIVYDFAEFAEINKVEGLSWSMPKTPDFSKWRPDKVVIREQELPDTFEKFTVWPVDL